MKVHVSQTKNPIYTHDLGFCINCIAITFEYPVAGNFGPRGGLRITPEFLALWLALSLYTGAFIAEIVRAGILAVNKGQTEAYSALGLSRGQGLRLVVIPQAMRVIIPPLTSQYLNLTKNSSLATAIAYPGWLACSVHASRPERHRRLAGHCSCCWARR